MLTGASPCYPVTFCLIRACLAGCPLLPRDASSKGVCPPGGFCRATNEATLSNKRRLWHDRWDETEHLVSPLQPSHVLSRVRFVMQRQHISRGATRSHPFHITSTARDAAWGGKPRGSSARTSIAVSSRGSTEPWFSRRRHTRPRSVGCDRDSVRGHANIALLVNWGLRALGLRYELSLGPHGRETP